MNKQKAKELILLHAFSHPNLDNSKMETGFLGSLRPYIGLNQENFNDIMNALRILAPGLQTQNFVDKELLSALWGICFYSRLWGIDEDGMLVRNHLINAEDVKLLREWVNVISYAVGILLEGGDIEEAFSWYKNEH